MLIDLLWKLSGRERDWITLAAVYENTIEKQEKEILRRDDEISALRIANEQLNLELSKTKTAQV